MLEIITHNLLFTQGIYVFLFCISLIAIGLYSRRFLAYAGCIGLLFSLFFFRNPDRQCPHAPHAIIAPADGTIVAIKHNPVDELSSATVRISIYLSLWDAHVQWSPVAGKVKSIDYHPGSFSFAFTPKSSLHNEHNDIHIITNDGIPIMVRQIAGTIARRISCWVQPADTLKQCEKIGMIRFGSRVDLFLPSSVQLDVEVGDHVLGGSTIIGYFKR